MSIQTRPVVAYRGEEHSESLSGDTANLVRDALLPCQFLTKNGSKSVRKAIALMGGTAIKHLEEYPHPDATPRAIAALVEVEDLLNDGEAYKHDLKVLDPEKLHEDIKRALRATGRRLVEQGSRRFWLPIDVWVLAFEDDLSDYRFPPELEGKIESIREIRFLDRNTVTHLCSIEGSYWAQFLDMQVTLKDEYADDDQLRTDAYDWVVDANRETGDVYLDQRQVDRKIEANALWTVYHYGNPGFDLDEAEGDDEEEKINTVMEAVRERLHCNAVL